ncbi:MAG: glycerate kinase, partial [Clostridia bacterium]|nr:glycerate kinase [Clostridia bacterium]
MNIVIAIDSFKGSLTSLEAGHAAKRGIQNALPDADVTVFPIADGGEGTVDALVYGTGGQTRTVTACDPLVRPIACDYGALPDGTAVIEIAAAAGLTHLTANERNPLVTTTYGVGEMILDAIKQGCRRFIIGLGGSATNDGGVGMLQALGFDFLDAQRRPLARGACSLAALAYIEDTHVPAALRDCTFEVACDVRNPLCGENGCSAVFAPQKGATPAMIDTMDKALAHYAAVAETFAPHADANTAGAGAAGGLGFAFMTFLNARLVSGIDCVLSALPLEQAVKTADLVITGEGRLDGQTVMGKAPIGVAAIAKAYHKPVIALAGSLGDGGGACNPSGIDALFSIVPSPCWLEV